MEKKLSEQPKYEMNVENVWRTKPRGRRDGGALRDVTSPTNNL